MRESEKSLLHITPVGVYSDAINRSQGSSNTIASTSYGDVFTPPGPPATTAKHVARPLFCPGRSLQAACSRRRAHVAPNQPQVPLLPKKAAAQMSDSGPRRGGGKKADSTQARRNVQHKPPRQQIG